LHRFTTESTERRRRARRKREKGKEGVEEVRGMDTGDKHHLPFLRLILSLFLSSSVLSL